MRSIDTHWKLIMIQEVHCAMSLQGRGGVRVAQFIAAACDKRLAGICSIADSSTVQQCTVRGYLSLAGFAQLLQHSNLSISMADLLKMMTSAGLKVDGDHVLLQEVEVCDKVYPSIPWRANALRSCIIVGAFLLTCAFDLGPTGI